MATKTSSTSGLWSNPDTWGGSIPASGDVVIVSAGHAVTYDIDMSTWTSGVDLTVNGLLKCTDASGYYALMLSANMDGSGVLQAGESPDNPLPNSTVFDIFIKGKNITCSGGLQIKFYCTNPSKLVSMTLAPMSTTYKGILVDSDITEWNDFPRKHLIFTRKLYDGSVSLQNFFASGVSIVPSGDGSAIYLAANPTNAMPSGSYVGLVSRNIRVLGTTTNSKVFDTPTSSYFGLEVSGDTSTTTSARYAIYSPSDCEFNGVLENLAYGLYYPNDSKVGGLMGGVYSGMQIGNRDIFMASGYLLGCTYGIRDVVGVSGYGTMIGCQNSIRQTAVAGDLRLNIVGGYYGPSTCAGLDLYGVVSGCYIGVNNAYNCVLNQININNNFAIYQCYGDVVSGIVSGYANGVYLSHNMTFATDLIGTNTNYGMQMCSGILKNITVSGHVYDIRDPSVLKGYGSSLKSTNQVSWVTTERGMGSSVDIYDIDGNTGSYKGWQSGGTCYTIPTSSAVLSSAPVTNDVWYRLDLKDSANPYSYNIPVELKKNERKTFTTVLKLSTTSFTALPVAGITSVFSDPVTTSFLTSASGTATTNWQILTVTYIPSADMSTSFKLTACDDNASIYFTVLESPASYGQVIG